MKKTVAIDKAPAAIGPYSQAVWIGDFLFCSGQLGVDPSRGALVEGGVRPQAEQSLKNIETVLASQGLAPVNVVKTTVFLTDMANFKEVNEAYGKVFESEQPARSCVAVAALPMGGLVEIEVVAHR